VKEVLARRRATILLVTPASQWASKIETSEKFIQY
jgi:hypothetical protein